MKFIVEIEPNQSRATMAIELEEDTGYNKKQWERMGEAGQRAVLQQAIEEMPPQIYPMVASWKEVKE